MRTIILMDGSIDIGGNWVMEKRCCGVCLLVVM